MTETEKQKKAQAWLKSGFTNTAILMKNQN